MASRWKAAGEQGETLIEALVALVVFGIGFAVIIGGMATSQVVTDHHRKDAKAETVLRQYAETVKASSYAPCVAGPSTTTTTVFSGYTLTVTGVKTWNGTAFVAACPSPDGGLQLISITATSLDGRARQSVDVVKRLP